MMRVLVALATLPMLASAFVRCPSKLKSTRPVEARAVVRGAAEMRTPIIAGNWKMNPTSLAEAKELATAIKGIVPAGVDVAICPPSPFIPIMADTLAGSGVAIGGQDLYTEPKGAFTGAVSASQLSSAGCTYVLAGHSERRVIFGESDEAINAKVRTILDGGMKCILCIGESKDEYEQGLNKAVCAVQLAKGLDSVSEAELANVVVAYEPVWAIGTGLTCPPEGAQDVHASIRGWFSENYSKEAAGSMRIQYGGSVTPETVDELMSKPDVDGALVGGASLLADKFSRIVNFQTPGAAPPAAALSAAASPAAPATGSGRKWWRLWLW